MFKSGIVLHYVSEYSQSQFEKNYEILEKYQQDEVLNLSIDNDVSLKNISENLPIGSIICRVFNNIESIEVCLPMFSSHISMPIKPNEIIWFFKDDTSFTNDDLENNHPMFAIKNYWLSRKIGTKISEDLNYTFFQRDSLITNQEMEESKKYQKLLADSDDKKNEKIYTEESKNIVKLPDFENELLYVDFFGNGFLENGSEVVKKEKNISFFPDAVPRWFSKPHELTLQGSNNTLINLTKTNNSEEKFINKGAIDIVSGRFFLDDYIEEEEEDFHIFENKIIKNKEEDREKTFKLKKTSFPKIENILGNLETLKSQKFYLNTEDIDESIEGTINIDKDASRIYISECDNIDNFNYYDTFWLSDQDSLTLESNNFVNSENIVIEKEYLNNEKISRNNLESISLDENDLTLPSIFIKSNNIRIVSRKKQENKANDLLLEEGSIRLIKESDDFSNYAHLCLEKDGQVLLDGKSVLLGNFKKEVIRQNISQIEDIDELPQDNDSFTAMHGNGNGLLIGYNKNLSEPLVLGNSLESMLKELIHINIFLVDELTKVSNDLLGHTHSGVMPGGGISQPPSAPPTRGFVTNTDNFVNSESSDISSRYNNLKDNLYHMLSRFAKTT